MPTIKSVMWNQNYYLTQLGDVCLKSDLESTIATRIFDEAQTPEHAFNLVCIPKCKRLRSVYPQTARSAVPRILSHAIMVKSSSKQTILSIDWYPAAIVDARVLADVVAERQRGVKFHGSIIHAKRVTIQPDSRFPDENGTGGMLHLILE